MTPDEEQHNLNTRIGTHPKKWIKDKDITLVVLCCLPGLQELFYRSRLASPVERFVSQKFQPATSLSSLYHVISRPANPKPRRGLGHGQAAGPLCSRGTVWASGGVVGRWVSPEIRCALGEVYVVGARLEEGVRHSTVICLFTNHLIVSLE